MFDFEDDGQFFSSSSEIVLEEVAAAAKDSLTACECMLFLSRLLSSEALNANSTQQQRLLLSSRPSSSSVSVTSESEKTNQTATLPNTLTTTIDRTGLLLDAVERALESGILKAILQSPLPRIRSFPFLILRLLLFPS